MKIGKDWAAYAAAAASVADEPSASKLFSFVQQQNRKKKKPLNIWHPETTESGNVND